MSANSIATYPINPSAYSLGGARFSSVKPHGAGHSISVMAEAGIHNPGSIKLHVGAGSHRTMLALDVDEAEALTSCLNTAIKLRQAATTIQAVKDQAQARAFFADSSGGPLEAC